jgi:excisionase family DNA binding protein
VDAYHAYIGINVLRCAMSKVERDYLTVSETARALGLPLRTVRYRLQHGIMRGIAVSPRLWLVPRAEVEHWQGRGKLRPGRKPAAR